MEPNKQRRRILLFSWVGCGFFTPMQLVLFLLQLVGFFSVRNSKQMPMDVSDALKDIFMCEGNLTKAEAENYMKQLIQAKRYQRETWS